MTIRLHDHFRVGTDDELQWTLERLRSQKKGGWQSISWCRTKSGLLRCIKEKVVGDIAPEAQQALYILPEWREEALNE